jgi:hypothetical protein
MIDLDWRPPCAERAGVGEASTSSTSRSAGRSGVRRRASVRNAAHRNDHFAPLECASGDVLIVDRVALG